MTPINLTLTVANKLELKPNADILTTTRNLNILRHYQAQLDRGRMGLEAAMDRAISDLKGQNYFAEREQHGELRS